MPFADQLAREINRKSSRESIKNQSQETPRGIQNRLKIASGTLSGHPVASKSVPKASRERLGSVLERPRRAPGVPGGQERPGTPEKAPWSAWERAEPTKIDAKSRPGTKNSSCLGTVHSQTDFRSIFARFSIDFRMFAQGVRGALSRRTSIDFRFEHAKPDPHETLPIAMNSRVGPFEASRRTRAREP